MSIRRKPQDVQRARAVEQTLDLPDQSAAYNYRVWFEGLPLQQRLEEIDAVKTVKINSDAWSELIMLKDFQIENLWLTSVQLTSENFSSFCKAFVAAATYNGEFTIQMIESFDLKFQWCSDGDGKNDYSKIYSGLCWFDELNTAVCHLKSLKIYVTVDAGELQLLFWDRFLATPGLCQSVRKLVVLTNSRNIFATPESHTVGLKVVRYISQWKALRELSLHGLWTGVQSVIVEQVPLRQLSLLSITPLHADELAHNNLETDMLPHMQRCGEGQVLGFYGVNGVPEAVKPFSEVPTNILVIDLTTVRKPNGQGIVRSLSEAEGPFACNNLYFRRKGSKEPLEDLNHLELRSNWSHIIKKTDSIVFECRFDFDTSTTKVWDATFASLMTAIADHQGPCRLKRLRFEECLMDVMHTGYADKRDVCERALKNLPFMMDLNIPLTHSGGQYVTLFGLRETVMRQTWTPAMHQWCDAERIRKPFFDITVALLEAASQCGLPTEVLHLVLQQCFNLAYVRDPERDAPYYTESEARQRLVDLGAH
eukprot:TRINITY_DN9164_c0_g2_i1.p1 TRINITY_DN9164_c0_g2~~TRINITY_DN9164_c0_g2_i1.p1  ORF type:complete len:566 (+),score=77.59 TRINITY_DN9164_c0_g2_i1:89-1699(+)